MRHHLFCFGLGYSARHLAKILPAADWRISGTVRRPEAQARWAAQGIDALLFDGTQSLAEERFADVTHLLISIPPDDAGDPALRHFAPVIARLNSPLHWVGYLSTTGVYGDHQGRWVDEQTPEAPGSARTRRRLSAEQDWRRWAAERDIALQIFRLAGIYGPGRTILDDLRAGTARQIVQPGQYFSRIHVEDIAQSLKAAMEGDRRSVLYNVCDDLPAPSDEVLRFGAALLGIQPPPPLTLAEAGLSPMALSFWADNKRVRNDRLKRELGIRLKFPTYREGLTSLTNPSAGP